MRVRERVRVRVRVRLRLRIRVRVRVRLRLRLRLGFGSGGVPHKLRLLQLSVRRTEVATHLRGWCGAARRLECTPGRATKEHGREDAGTQRDRRHRGRDASCEKERRRQPVEKREGEDGCSEAEQGAGAAARRIVLVLRGGQRQRGAADRAAWRRRPARPWIASRRLCRWRVRACGGGSK